jgi:alpha-beta hydrolase superfamily lysophospholipase
LYLHGIQSHGKWFLGSARRLAEAGFAVLLPDRRGSGRNEVDRGHAASAKILLRDVADCLDELHVRTGFDRFHLLGISWGGKLALASMRQVASRVVSLTLVAPGLFPRVDLSVGQKVRVGLSALGSGRALFDIPLADPALFTGNPEGQRFIRDDPLALRQVTASFLVASRQLDGYAQALAGATACPLHLLLAGEDRIIDNAQTERFIFGLNWPARTITQYDHAGHTLEFEPDPEPYFADLVAWLESQVGTAGSA